MNPGIPGSGEVAKIHRVQAEAFPVNAYLVETENGVVAVDSLLAVSDARALRARLASIGKPLLAVLVTHPHPDHYGGLTELVADDDVPILATAGVAHVIRRDDAEKEAVLRPMFGDEWPSERTFPDRIVEDGETVTFDGVGFRALDLGPGESPHDSVWVVAHDPPVAFVGDVVYNHMHGYLADGHYEAWLENLQRLRATFDAETVFYVGHGEPASPALIDWQIGYIRTFIDAVRDTAAAGHHAAEQVTRQMQAYLSTDDLLFLMQLSIDPLRARLQAGGGEGA
jgi:glyoxylase-like metal-dependent hydrolase (beta-lactamase superfamily II)